MSTCFFFIIYLFEFLDADIHDNSRWKSYKKFILLPVTIFRYEPVTSFYLYIFRNSDFKIQKNQKKIVSLYGLNDCN